MAKVARIHIRLNKEGLPTLHKDFAVQPFETVMVTRGETFPLRVDLGQRMVTAEGGEVWESGFVPVECDWVEVLDVET